MPDTVLLFVTVRNGRLSTEMLVNESVPIIYGPDSLVTDRAIQGNAAPPVTPLYRPELYTGFDISNCDDGYEVSPSGVICDTSTFGHMYMYAEGSRNPSLGVYWQPSFRSPWTASVGHTGNEWVFSVRKGWRLW